MEGLDVAGEGGDERITCSLACGRGPTVETVRSQLRPASSPAPSGLGLALCLPPFGSGDAGEALDREEMAHRVVACREAGKVRLDPGHVPLGQLARRGRSLEARSWRSSGICRSERRLDAGHPRRHPDPRRCAGSPPRSAGPPVPRWRPRDHLAAEPSPSRVPAPWAHHGGAHPRVQIPRGQYPLHHHCNRATAPAPRRSGGSSLRPGAGRRASAGTADRDGPRGS